MVVAELITPTNFAKYGGVISSAHQLDTAESASANYGTARKLFKVSPIENHYEAAPSGRPATANWNMFRCAPPTHLISDHRQEDGGLSYKSKVLERHPFSTQTFVPMGRHREDITYMVIVAPSDESNPEKLPLVDQCEAFTVKGDQAVTYGAGTWHAPMIALGDVVDFAVLIHENGVPEEDCEEVYLDTLTIEFTTESLEEPETPKRKPQSQEEFDTQLTEFHHTGPPHVKSGLDDTTDQRFNSKQVKYEVEKHYFNKDWQKVIDLVDSHNDIEPKIASELQLIKEKALTRRVLETNSPPEQQAALHQEQAAASK